jgi:hypothetical protein
MGLSSRVKGEEKRRQRGEKSFESFSVPRRDDDETMTLCGGSRRSDNDDDYYYCAAADDVVSMMSPRSSYA